MKRTKRKSQEIPHLTMVELQKLLNDPLTLQGAKELHEELRLIFRLPEKPIILD